MQRPTGKTPDPPDYRARHCRHVFHQELFVCMCVVVIIIIVYIVTSSYAITGLGQRRSLSHWSSLVDGLKEAPRGASLRRASPTGTRGIQDQSALTVNTTTHGGSSLSSAQSLMDRMAPIQEAPIKGAPPKSASGTRTAGQRVETTFLKRVGEMVVSGEGVLWNHTGPNTWSSSNLTAP